MQVGERCSKTFQDLQVEKILDGIEKTYKPKYVTNHMEWIRKNGMLKLIWHDEPKPKKDGLYWSGNTVSIEFEDAPFTKDMVVYHKIKINVQHNLCRVATSLISASKISDMDKIVKNAFALWDKEVQKQKDELHVQEKKKMELKKQMQNLGMHNVDIPYSNRATGKIGPYAVSVAIPDPEEKREKNWNVDISLPQNQVPELLAKLGVR